MRQASARLMPDTTVVSCVLVRTRGAFIPLGLGTGVAEATIRVATSGAAVISPFPIAALQSPK